MGVLYVLAITSISVYGIVLAGWASNSKYSMLGSLRSSAQMISYELAMGLSLVALVVVTGTLDMNAIVEQQKQVWFFFLQPIGAIIFMITALAEVNRAPFDMPEAEQELTSGYNTEYSGMKFALFYMAEYIKMIVISALAVTFFFGGYREPLPLFVTQAMPFLSVDNTPLLGPMYLAIEDHRAVDRAGVGARHAAALPLRSADEVRLDGAAADFAGVGDGDGVDGVVERVRKLG